MSGKASSLHLWRPETRATIIVTLHVYFEVFLNSFFGCPRYPWGQVFCQQKWIFHTINVAQHQMLHPWPRDTGKCAAQGPNIMSPEAELEGRGRRHGGRGRHNVAQGQHIFQSHEARGVILTLLYRQADIDTGILTVVKSNMQTCDIGSNVPP